MSQEIIMPKLGLTMTHGRITRWLKKEGDQVSKGEAIVEIETDKISSEVESEADGYILKILAGEGEEREITAPICIVGEKDEIPAVQPDTGKVESVQSEAGRIFITPIAKKIAKENDFNYESVEGTGPGGRIVKKDILTAIGQEKIPEEGIRAKITPLAKRMAEENDIDCNSIRGTGPDGRIVKGDIIAAMEQKNNAKAVEMPGVEDTGVKDEVKAGAVYQNQQNVSRKVPLAGMRKVIARRLSQSKQDIPHVYFKSTVDATGLMELKNRLAETVRLKTGKKLSLNDLIIKAAATALQDFDDINAALADDEIRYHKDINIGMAVSVEKGLVVPVIKDAGKASISDINRQAAELAAKARNGKLTPDDMTGGTFTISNLGAYGIDEFSAIINPPESAILAVGKAKEAPWAENGRIEAKTIMVLTLSVDHRVIDGALAAQFMKKLKDLLEDPYSLLV